MTDQQAQDLNAVSAAISQLKEAHEIAKWDTRNKDWCLGAKVTVQRAEEAYRRLAASMR